jgi:NADPH:quinone reductase-like Zn-dependent oxidoreductase
MKAFVSDRYGSPDVMRLEDVPMPEATGEQVLVRVHASSVNAHDWHMLRGKPYITRPSAGWTRPKRTVLGLDAAGVVEAVGPAVTDLAVGDEVFGSRSGAFAEYVSGKNFVQKPATLSFEEAAAIPTAGFTALQALRDKAAVQPGDHVLVNGAGGGVGTFAVQIAKAMGAEVTAATSGGNLELMRSLGADHVIDHRRENVAAGPVPYDVILDVGGQPSLGRLARVLSPTGRLVIIGPGNGQWIGPIARILGAVVRSRFSTQQLIPFLAHVDRDDLLVLRGYVEAGAIRPVIDRTVPFEQIPDAIRHVEAGKARGKVVITRGAVPTDA